MLSMAFNALEDEGIHSLARCTPLLDETSVPRSISRRAVLVAAVRAEGFEPNDAMRFDESVCPA